MKDSDHWVVGVCPDDPLALVQGRLYPEITANCVIAWRRNIPYSQAVNKMIEEINAYDEIILGFPIWWYVAPTIVNTFLEKYNFFFLKRSFCLLLPVEVDLEIRQENCRLLHRTA